MVFSEMPYQRPDLAEIKNQIQELTAQLKAASSYEAARDIFRKKDILQKQVMTQEQLAAIRHSIDTRDAFYKEEYQFWNDADPLLEEYLQEWTKALLDSPFRSAFETEFGETLLSNAEMKLKTFSPEIIGLMQEENKLVDDYMHLIASAAIPFEGDTYTISQLTPFKNDPDDSRRLAAWKAEGAWYKEHQKELDTIYDRLTHLRDEMGRKLGYDGYTQLGYYRMTRNCYTKEDVERFRQAVRNYLVPVADKLFRAQAERLGKEYPMSFADNELEFRTGNPRPQGTADEILMAGRKFYDELSPETSEFFRKMLKMELLDVLSTEGKEGGGYCTDLPDYGMPFIFANFNGTKHDVEVVTHEAGHAFASYINRDRVPHELMWPSMEGCEVHSMSMEFMAWPWAEEFFGKDTEKFLYAHLASALKFIPYGTMVDHFQHMVYEKPDMTPKERHGVWKELLGIYMPWQRLDGDIPFYSEGEGWQRQQHIYGMPFYYIDYCLAQTVALEFWAMIQKDQKRAWEKYMAYTRLGGTLPFTGLLKSAGLESPFEETCIRMVSEAAVKWLESFDSEKLK